MFRQGDILIVPIKEVPNGAKKRNDKVLAYGEATGHAHRLADPVEVFEMDGVILFSTPGTQLKHEEHETIDIPSGDYEVIRQKEYTPERIRYVED